MFERLSEVLEEEELIPVGLLDMDGAALADLSMETVVDALRDRIVRDQFTPKAKASHRAKTTATPKPELSA